MKTFVKRHAKGTTPAPRTRDHLDAAKPSLESSFHRRGKSSVSWLKS